MTKDINFSIRLDTWDLAYIDTIQHYLGVNQPQASTIRFALLQTANQLTNDHERGAELPDLPTIDQMLDAIKPALDELDRIGSDRGFEPGRYQFRINALDKISRLYRRLETISNG